MADYFAMLAHELRGEPFNKSEHNRRLQRLLNGRSAAAIEFKHANISAVLVELGYPYVEGYKPRANYQALLLDEVVATLAGNEEIAVATARAVDAPAVEAPAPRSIADILIPAPIREVRGGRVGEARVSPPVPRLGVNYLEREARNASLGDAGEAFVLDFERRRLWESGQRKLAERIEHVAKTQGDGLGYDIVSFDSTGKERLIEVKTTSFGSMTPFFASRREVTVSEEQASAYSLYRVFKFRETPKIFVLDGSLRHNCVLDAVQYRARLA